MKYSAKWTCFCFLAVFFLATAVFGQSGDTDKKPILNIKKICLTFDNLPAERNYTRIERYEINDKILETLARHKIKAAAFVIGDNIEGDWEILVKWLEAGHTIGSFTYTGQDIDNVPIEMFLEDIAKGKETIEDFLISFKQPSRYFRFPYLHYGATTEIKTDVEYYLDEANINLAHASIVVEDFVYNLSLEKIINSRDSADFIELRDEYITHLLERLGNSETLAQEIMERPVRQILQLRLNRLNAYFLEDIIAALIDKGYGFISLPEALKDKVYSKRDAYFGVKSLSLLERIKYSNPDLLPAGE
nr:polysaccharide deacetylase family protein [candidate division Zixibacteria bacterium]